MSGWNHRVFKSHIKSFEGDEGEWEYSIRETYYDENGAITMHSNEPRPAFGEDIKGLKWSLEKMLEATEQPVVELRDGEDGYFIDGEHFDYAKNEWDDDE